MKKEMESLIQISQVEHSRLEEEKTKEKAKLDQVWNLAIIEQIQINSLKRY